MVSHLFTVSSLWIGATISLVAGDTSSQSIMHGFRIASTSCTIRPHRSPLVTGATFGLPPQSHQLLVRGGGTNSYRAEEDEEESEEESEEVEEEEDWDEYEQVQEEDEEDDFEEDEEFVTATEGDSDEEFVDADEAEADENLAGTEEDEINEELSETEEQRAEEEFVNVQEVIDEDALESYEELQDLDEAEAFGDEHVEEEEVFEEALEEVPGEPLADEVLDRMVTNTDDDSSAFVDRMELADAYDEGGETTTVDDASATTTAASTTATSTATAVGVGGGADDEEEVESATLEAHDEHVEPTEAEAPSPEAVLEHSEPISAATDAVETEPSTKVTEITDEMKKKLKALKYKSKDIKVMRPDVAAVAIANGLRRPNEGLPRNWYKEGTLVTGKPRRNAIKIGATLILLGSAAFLGLQAPMDIQSILGTFAGAVGTLSASSPNSSDQAPPSTQSVPSTQEVPAVTETEEAEEELPDPHGDEHTQSVKPFVHDVPPTEEELDHTWLDKGITKCGKAIKAFFRIKI